MSKHSPLSSQLRLSERRYKRLLPGRHLAANASCMATPSTFYKLIWMDLTDIFLLGWRSKVAVQTWIFGINSREVSLVARCPSDKVKHSVHSEIAGVKARSQ